MLEISAPVPFFQQQQQKTLSSKKSVMYTLYQAEVQKIIAEKGREKLIKNNNKQHLYSLVVWSVCLLLLLLLMFFRVSSAKSKQKRFAVTCIET